MNEDRVTWRRDTRGYYRSPELKNKKRCRVVWETEVGPIPPGYHIHHVNGIRSDDRLENLMCLSPSEHSAIHRGPNAPPKSPLTMEMWYAREKKKEAKRRKRRAKKRREKLAKSKS